MSPVKLSGLSRVLSWKFLARPSHISAILRKSALYSGDVACSATARHSFAFLRCSFLSTAASLKRLPKEENTKHPARESTGFFVRVRTKSAHRFGNQLCQMAV